MQSQDHIDPADDKSDFARSNQGFTRGPQSVHTGYAQDVNTAQRAGFGRGPAEGGTDHAVGPGPDGADGDGTAPLQPGEPGYYAFPETDQGACEARQGCSIEQPGSHDRLAEDPQ